MKRLTIWRYEDLYGAGPYNGDYWSRQDEMCNSHSEENGRPSWFWDELFEFKDSRYVSGCINRKALFAWFDGFHEDLKLAGFSVTSYGLPEDRVAIGHSGVQVAFDRGSVRPVRHP